MTKLPQPLQKLIGHLRKFPGVGSKTAERYAFQLLEWEAPSVEQLAESLKNLRQEITPCPSCNCLKTEDTCEFCSTDKRETSILCIVSSPKDIYPIEEMRSFRGLYHVLEALFSPLDGNNIEKINISKIKKRIDTHQIKDVILALDSTLEGDATALYLKEEMKNWDVSISRLAFGIPLGSSFEYVDPGTLARAFLGRQKF
jgi:recombination protein RecR